MKIPNPFSWRIHSLFIANDTFYREKILKYNITLIILIIKNILDTCISVDEKYFWYIYINYIKYL